MKSFFRLLLLISAPLWIVGCNRGPVDGEAVEAAVERMLSGFPESRLQDLYKSFFQDRFGPGHIIRDRQSALDYILSEIASADSFYGPVEEPCGWEGNYVRLNLSVVADGKISAEELTEALMESAKEVREEDVQRWKGEWAAILSIIRQSHPDLDGLDEDSAKIDSLLASGQYAFHHSKGYEEDYHPHYRILDADVLRKLLTAE